MYSFYLPLTSLIWRYRQRFEPVVFLIDDVPSDYSWENFPVTSVILRYLSLWNFTNIYFLSPNQSYPENNVLIGQNSRLFASMMCNFPSDSWMLTSDVDIWPVAPSSFFKPRKSSSTGIILNAFCCDTFTRSGVTFREYPITNLGLYHRKWQELMDCQCSCFRENYQVGPRAPCLQKIVAQVNKQLGDMFRYGSGDEGSSRWSYDQHLFSHRLHSKADIFSSVELIGRDTLSDRIDRSSWENKIWSESVLHGIVDSHVLRPGYTEENWQRLFPLLIALLEISNHSVLYQQIKRYHQLFVEAIQKSQ